MEISPWKDISCNCVDTKQNCVFLLLPSDLPVFHFCWEKKLSKNQAKIIEKYTVNMFKRQPVSTSFICLRNMDFEERNFGTLQE